MTAPELIDEVEIKRALTHLISRIDDKVLARDVITVVRAAYDAGYASCLVRRFTASDAARENLARALECLPKPPEVRS